MARFDRTVRVGDTVNIDVAVEENGVPVDHSTAVSATMSLRKPAGTVVGPFTATKVTGGNNNIWRYKSLTTLFDTAGQWIVQVTVIPATGDQLSTSVPAYLEVQPKYAA